MTNSQQQYTNLMASAQVHNDKAEELELEIEMQEAERKTTFHIIHFVLFIVTMGF